jgi:23S rRNA pseudouridine1911/1915/1917 synthase
MKIKKQFEITADEAGERLDLFLAGQFAGEYSRSQIQKWIDSGFIQTNRRSAKANLILKAGDRIEVEADLQEEIPPQAENIPLEILYEDDDLLVINKPVGMVVHPACGHQGKTLVNALLYHAGSLSNRSHPFRPGIVHRLDKNTSGLLVVAKNDWTHERLSRQFQKHSIERVYWVVVRGVVEHDELRCEEALGRSPLDRRKVIVKPVEGKHAVSHFSVKERFRNATLLEVRLETGRTHQIRVHLKHLGFPVLGDKDYGVSSHQIARQALHAGKLAFIHPRTKKKISFESKLPEDFLGLLSYLRENKQD